MCGWLVPYVRSRVTPGEFHPITAYLFVEYNIDCWYCWSFNNKVKGMTEDVARRAIDWLHDRGCRVLAHMGGEPLLRPRVAHKIVYYAAKRGFWIYVGTNGRLLRPDVADQPPPSPEHPAPAVEGFQSSQGENFVQSRGNFAKLVGFVGVVADLR